LWAARSAAERATLRVYGVKAIANELRVQLATEFERNDTDIAQAAVTALMWNVGVPHNRVTVTVSNGWVTLNGELDWQYQKEAAARALRDLFGVAAPGAPLRVAAPDRSLRRGGRSARRKRSRVLHPADTLTDDPWTRANPGQTVRTAWRSDIWLGVDPGRPAVQFRVL
jgi:hypothetical protein